MTNKIFTKEEWTKALQGLSDSYKVFVPVKDGDFHTFKPMNATKAPDFDFQNTRLSARSLVYPQAERMFEYSLDENDPEANIIKETPKDYSPQAIVGIRPCDAHGFKIVKPNFDNKEYRDPWWIQHFESTVLVGLGCNQPCSTCFCASVGGGPFNKDVLDVLIYDLGANFMVSGLTEKGEAFLSKAQGGKAADDAAVKQAEALATEAAKKVKADVPTDKLKDKVINDLFAAPFWQDVGFACLNCGTCTYLCPTCWCFDIQDEVLGKQGDRIRNWDSCMFPLFTLHGSGHNPRDQKFQRVRQRFMHKLKYYVDKYQGGVQCSGCGRCVRYCPVNIDIRQVAELMNNY
ncbi:Heterodisulfide reductase, iron-sulfur binding subunit family protein [uncultured Desulfobacterium sp.]|uniref:Heterodisulfide reductase, iron-sulfur binding subunit family protein n=1 Tax=uncultured Desulfobacterium sp. TaxID=201089 RepID=A0A445MRI7_9BACT|nr:Heterodisulfide reductase, iron-sulfur binding subunit family protein [uncultured Desulfobacterium sp.]